MSDFDFRLAFLAFGGEPPRILLAVGKVYLVFGTEEFRAQADATDAEAGFQNILLLPRVKIIFRVFSRPDFQKCTVPGTGNGRMRFSRQTGVENRGTSADQGNGSLGSRRKMWDLVRTMGELLKRQYSYSGRSDKTFRWKNRL
jgi:hypothetical protein